MEEKKQEKSNSIFSDIIPTGERNAISAANLAGRVGVSDLRALREMISQARFSGELIASSEAGYYYPANYYELSEYVSSMESRAKFTFGVIKAARKKLKELEKYGA